MAGKNKKQGSRPNAPGSARYMMGHLGLKSSPLAPTDSKLTSQYMVLDHMTAHYKNLSKAKPAIDTGTPKAWVISQKARDRARRSGLKHEHNRRNEWLANSIGSRPPTRDSAQDRDELIAMLESFSALDNGELDDVDGVHNVSSTVSTTKANRLNEEDMNLVNHMVSDSVQSPSRYHSQKVMKSNIPGTHSKPYSKASRGQHRMANNAGPATPRGRTPQASPGDLIEKQAHKFTEEKPFTPRTLKSKPEVQSRLSSFKYYTPPKKPTAAPPREAPVPVPRAGSIRGSFVSRPETPFSDGNSLMNETLMSRDLNQNETPMGVPPLDISLDADNMKWMKEQSQKGWLQEQSRKAQLRASARSRSDAGSDVGSLRHEPRMEATGHTARTLNGTQNLTREEELKYLEFITDVTNDVLDRGIFTNRVLKQVFDTHIEKKKHHLKPQKMREMLEDLRQDLGIPDDGDDDDMGMKSVRSYSPNHQLDGASTWDGSGHHNPGPRAARRKHLNGGLDGDHGGMSRGTMPNLRAGRPPLPRPSSRGTRSRPGSSCSNLHEVKEEAEDSSLTFTFSETPSSSGQADILKIDHPETEAAMPLEDIENGRNENHNMNDDLGLNVGDENLTHDDQLLGQTQNVEEDVFISDKESEGLDQTDAGRGGVSHEKPSFSGDLGNGSGEDEYAGSHHGEDEGESLTDLYSKHLTAGDDSTNLSLHGYEDDDFHGEENEGDDDTLKEEDVSETPRAPPKPTPRSRKAPTSTSEYTPRSTDLTIHTTSESVTVSELDDDEAGDF